MLGHVEHPVAAEVTGDDVEPGEALHELGEQLGRAASVRPRVLARPDMNDHRKVALHHRQRLVEAWVVKAIALEQRVNLGPEQPVVAQRGEVLLGRKTGVHGPEADEPFAIERAEEPIRLPDLIWGDGNPEAHRPVNARGVHRGEQARDLAVAVMTQVVDRMGQSALGRRVGPDVRVDVQDAHIFAVSPPSMTNTLPVMNSELGAQSRHISGQISCGSPMRRAGILRTRAASISCESEDRPAALR